MKFQNPSMHGFSHARADGQSETNMPRQRLRSWGHKNLVGDVKANPRDFYRYINSQIKTPRVFHP